MRPSNGEAQSSLDPVSIRLRGVSFGYRPGEWVLERVDLDIEPGLTLIVGPNGAGKSTLLRLIAGVEMPAHGALHIGGYDLWKQEVAARQLLAYVPEQPDLSPYATLTEILGLVCRLRGRPISRISEVLDQAGLRGHGDRSVRELSMGQRRRGLLAAAWIGTPRALILDEPLEAMDRGGRELVVQWARTACQTGATALVVTHEIEPFVSWADRAISVHGGQVELKDLSNFAAEEKLAQVDRWAR